MFKLRTRTHDHLARGTRRASCRRSGLCSCGLAGHAAPPVLTGGQGGGGSGVRGAARHSLSGTGVPTTPVHTRTTLAQGHRHAYTGQETCDHYAPGGRGRRRRRAYTRQRPASSLFSFGVKIARTRICSSLGSFDPPIVLSTVDVLVVLVVRTVLRRSRTTSAPSPGRLVRRPGASPGPYQPQVPGAEFGLG